MILLTVPQAARELSVSPSTIRRLIARGELPVVRIRSAVRLRMTDRALLEDRPTTNLERFERIFSSAEDPDLVALGQPETITFDPAISLENGDILHVTWGSDGTHTERVERAESTVRRTVNDRKVGGDDRDRTDA